MFQITVFDNLADAADHWQRAESEGQSLLFQTYAWGSVWFETIGKALGMEPCLVLLHSENGALFLPMAIETRGLGVRALGFLDGGLSDHTMPILLGDPAALTAAQLPALARRLARRANVDLVDWRHLVQGDEATPNPLITEVSRPTAYFTHALDLFGTWSEFKRDRLSTSHQAGSRRRWRRLCAQGTPRFVVATNPHEALAILETTLQHKAARYVATGRDDRFATGAYPAFYREMTRRHVGSGLVHVAALFLDDAVIASHWGCVHRNSFYWLMPAYDAEWGKASPGRLLLDYLVEWSFEAGLEVFDFTIGDEAYKNTFANRHAPLYRSVFPRTALGYAYDWKDRLNLPPTA